MVVKAMPRAEDMRGIETRTAADGRPQYRGTVPHPEDRKRKLRGPWTYSFAEARGWRVRAQAKASQGISILRPDELPTVREASAVFLAGIADGTILSRRTKRRYAAATVRGYVGDFRDWINPALGDVPVDRLRRSEVQRFSDTLAASLSGSTVRNIVHALCALYTYLLPRHDELVDPTAGLLLPSPNGARERYADTEEIADLLDALPHALAMPWALAFLAGLRRGELQAFPASLVDLDDGWLDVAWSVDPVAGFKGPKSYAGVRAVPIFEALRPYLERQLDVVRRRVGRIVPATDEHPGTLLLPCGDRESRYGHQHLGTPYMKKVRKVWTDAKLQPIGLHEARHSFGTAIVRAGYDLKTVQEWMGHADASTTLDVYAKRRGRVDASTLTGRMDEHLRRV